MNSPRTRTGKACSGASAPRIELPRLTRAERVGWLVWPVLAVVLESPSCDAILPDGLGLALALTVGAATVLAARRRAARGPVELRGGDGCRRLGTSLVIVAEGGRGRVQRWLFPGDLPDGALRRLRVHLECLGPAGVR